MNQHNVIMALATAIRLRDAPVASEDVNTDSLIKELAGFDIFSNRQIKKIIGPGFSERRLKQISPKHSKTGGSVNPNHLEMIRVLVFQSSTGVPNWDLVREIVQGGTSQTFLSKLTGINKSTMNRKIRESI